MAAAMCMWCSGVHSQPINPPMPEVAQMLLRAGAIAPFGRPMSMTSRVESGSAEGTVDGIVDRPLQNVATALADANRWCAVLVLHVNNKACSVRDVGNARHIELRVARKYDQPVDQAYPLDFRFEVLKMSSDELPMRLQAPSGPLGTSDYEIRLDAVPAGVSRSAVRLAYSYRQGSLTGLGMDLYFATVGRGKVGFSTEPSGGATSFVSGVRGLVERNLMRYFLAVDAAAATPEVPGPLAFERRLRDWFAATERYPRQLHEVDLGGYLAQKRPLVDVGTAGSAK